MGQKNYCADPAFPDGTRASSILPSVWSWRQRMTAGSARWSRKFTVR